MRDDREENERTDAADADKFSLEVMPVISLPLLLPGAA